MATWEDGPEYAPAQRPGGFFAPTVAPLDSGPAAQAFPPLPAHAPEGYSMTPQPPLAQLSVKPSESRRDPREAYAVGHDVITGAPGIETNLRDPRAPFQLEGRESFTDKSAAEIREEPVQEASFPVGNRLPDPLPQQQPRFPHATGPWNSSAQAFPQPGTPGWFAPAPPSVHAPRPLPLAAWSSAMGPAVWMSLALGIVPIVTSPVLFILAAIMAWNRPHHTTTSRKTFVAGFVLLVLISLLSLSYDGQQFEGWWDTLSSASAWVCATTLVISGCSVLFEMRRRENSQNV